MSTSVVIELAGYVGSVLVLVAFLMTSVVKLRVVNSIGSLIFAVYALIIHSYPTAIMNFCLVLINIHYLWGLRKKETKFELVSVDSKDSFLEYMLGHYREDMNKCFPGLTLDINQANRAYIVCCNTVPAGVMLGCLEKGTLHIMLDYSIPAYRDCSVGEYLIKKLPAQGISRLIYSGPVQNHEAYLGKIGFEKQGETYVKEL